MAETFRFALGYCGSRALATLDSQAPLRVAAVFERSFYLEAAGAFACLGGPEIGLGPLNGTLDTPGGMNWPASGLRVGMRCARSPGAIHLGGRFTLALGAARSWRPAAAPDRPDPAAVRSVLDRVQVAGPKPSALDGLTAGREATAAAARWLARVFGSPAAGVGDDCGWVSRLVGLGPGLTPSGDDYLGGIMLALHGLDRPEAVGRLATLCLPLAASASNAISRAHLAAAAEGEGGAALHSLLNDMLRGDCARLGARLAEVGRIGQVSGWDGLAGILAVLRAWSAAAPPRRGLVRAEVIEPPPRNPGLTA